MSIALPSPMPVKEGYKMEVERNKQTIIDRRLREARVGDTIRPGRQTTKALRRPLLTGI